MDESVRSAMARWPDVPAVYGYIGVSRRGDFLLQGHRVTHPRTHGFIARNYGLDEQGRAFFQNGPQRAYADLEATPWIYRLHDNGELYTHSGSAVDRLDDAFVTRDGDVVLTTELGPGLLHDQDLDLLPAHLRAGGSTDVASALEALYNGDEAELHLELPAGRTRLAPVDGSRLPAVFGYVPFPEPVGDTPHAVSDYRPAWRPAARDPQEE